MSAFTAEQAELITNRVDFISQIVIFLLVFFVAYAVYRFLRIFF